VRKFHASACVKSTFQAAMKQSVEVKAAPYA